MSSLVTSETLAKENQRHKGSAGVSQHNSHLGFLPAFYDSETDRCYPSRFADQQPAPIHILDGLPKHLVVSVFEDSSVKSVKSSIVSGFLLADVFYTREQAAFYLANN